MGFTNKKFANRIDADTEQILSIDFYQHKAIMQAIQAPFKALEAGNLTNGMISARLSIYLLEQLAGANKVIEKKDELINHIKVERQKILDENELKEVDEAFKTRIAYAKLAFILEKIEFKKPSSTEYKV